MSELIVPDTILQPVSGSGRFTDLVNDIGQAVHDGFDWLAKDYANAVERTADMMGGFKVHVQHDQ